MTQKEALRQLQAYGRANGLALAPDSIARKTYAIILADGDAGEVTTRYPHDRISAFFTPKELLSVWLEGYHAGINKRNEPPRHALNSKKMKSVQLSEITRKQMANRPGKWPTVPCYRELLLAACRRFGCTLDEARGKYGLLTNSEWHKLLND